MTQEKKFYLTKEGLEKIQKDYEALKAVKFAKTSGESPKIWHSEDVNPEYISFQEDVGLLEAKITELGYVLKNYEPIKPPVKSGQSVVGLGATVVAEIDGELDEFTIVGTLEADPAERRISDESPIGKSFLGKKAGDTIVIKTPLVNHSCKIKKIKYGKA